MKRIFSSLCLLVLFSTTTLAQTASLSGRVSDGSTGILSTVTLQSLADGKPFTATTASDGSYTFTGLFAGSYYAYVSWASGLYLEEVFPDIPCTGFCEPTRGSPIIISDGASIKGIDFVLTQGARVAGTVRDGSSALKTIKMTLLDSTGTKVLSTDYSDSLGKYSLMKVPAGSYRLYSENRQGYFDQVFGIGNCVGGCADEALWSQALAVVLSPGEQRVIDLSLVKGGATVTGKVLGRTSPSKLTPIVEIYQNGGLTSRFTVTTPGLYTSTGGLPTGQYKLRFRESNYWDFVLGCGDNCDVAAGTTVTLTAPGSTTLDVTMLSKLTCSNLGDDDGDGSLNCFDKCDKDRTKWVAGLCGCNVPDTDANGNGVIDCLHKDEIRVQLSGITELVSKLKPAGRRQPFGLLANLKVASKQLAAELEKYSISALSDMSNIQASKRLARVLARVSHQIWSDSKEFRKARRKALRFITRLSTGVQ